jgi:hypothetical protein
VFFEIPLSVSENDMENLEVFPNPASGSITIKLRQTAQSTLTVFDAQGSKVFNEVFEDTITIIDLNNFPKGIYLLHVQQKNKLYIRKVVLF